jgi:hypothetical protein
MINKSCFLLAVSVLFLASPSRAQTDDEVVEEVGDSFREPLRYAGSFSGVNVESGTFCENRKEYQVFWEARVRNVVVELGQEGSAAVKVDFDRSRVSAAGWRQGGFLCMWNGGRGETEVRSATAQFRLLPRPDGSLRVEADSMFIGGLKFKNIQVYLPLIGMWAGDAPEWLNEWITRNINALSKHLLASSLRNRVNDALSESLATALDAWKRSRPQPQNVDLVSH